MALLSLRTTLLLAIFLLSSDRAWSQWTGIQANPTAPVYGRWATYSLVGTDPGNISGSLWEYKCNGPGCTNGYGTMSDNVTLTSAGVYEVFAGTFTVRCTLTVQGNELDPNPPPIVLTTDVTVDPPDAVRIASGLNVNTQVNQVENGGTSKAFGVTLIFVVQACGWDCGPYVTGFCQERITGKTLHPDSIVPQTFPDDAGWVPSDNNNSAFYTWDDWEDYLLEIVDRKVVDLGNADLGAWASVPYPTVWYTRTQNLQLNTTDACGNPVTYSLGSVVINTVITGPTTFQIQQQ